jgi:small subunit ribosomal protein S17
MAVKEKIGIVVSDKMNSTRIVAVDERIIHKRYKKVITRTRRYAVHDSEAASSMGDKVCIRETRPISKTKKLDFT